MRLLIVDEEFIAGGVETLRLQLVPELARRCESVTWVLSTQARAHFASHLSSRDGLLLEDLQAPRGSLTWLAGATARWLPHRMKRRCERVLLNRRLRGLARRHACTRVLTTCVFSQAPYRLPIPLAGFICDVNPVLPEATKRNMLQWLLKADAIFGISDFTCEALRELSPGQSKKIHSVPLAPPGRLRSSNSSEESCDFYFPAAPNAHKGHAALLRAACELAKQGVEFRLVLSGPGTDAFRPGVSTANGCCLEVQRILSEHESLLQDRVLILGDLSPERIGPMFAATRCVVLPSSYEGFGLPLVEALVQGRPVICSDIPAFREQLERYGFLDQIRLVPAGDVAELAEAMKAQLQEPRVPFAPPEARARLSRWTWADAASRCIEALEALG